MNKPKKETVGTKYLLIGFGDFKGNQKLITQLFNQFTPILSSSFLKFHFGDDYVIAHFETEETQKNVREFCNMVLEETVCNFILLPHNKNVMVSLTAELQDFLFNLENNEQIISDIVTDNEDTLDEKEFMEHKLEKLNLNKNVEDNKLSLDEILDKIQEKGIDQLTEKEKQQLYDYSKGI